MAVTRPATHRSISHLLLSGHNPLSPPSTSQSSSALLSRQSPSNPSLSPIPFNTWLSQLGREVDTYPLQNYNQIHSISSSTGHSLICYRNSRGVDRVIGLGRNESGQLGIGFTSQEGTRGLVEGFEGESVLKVKTAVQASYLLVKEDDTRNRLYSIGNSSRGKLGQPNLYSRKTPSSSNTDEEYQDEEEEEPVTRVLPRATLIDDLPLESGKIVQIETGYEHLLVLTEAGHLYGTGCNTDGQLSLSSSNTSDHYSLTRIPLSPLLTTQEGGILKILSGGDTSGLITKSGKLYTWGNSEYGQGGHGKVLDQVTEMVEAVGVREVVLREGGRRIIDYQCGGSFGVVLDDRNNVYTLGYGALGLPPTTTSSPNPSRFNPYPTLVPSLSSSSQRYSSPITRIRAAFGYAVAISDDNKAGEDKGGGGGGGKIWSWGLNNQFGRLGLGTTSSNHSPSNSGAGGGGENRALRIENYVDEPKEVRLPIRELGLEEEVVDEEGMGGGKKKWRLGEVELGDEGMWVEVREEVRVE
ncbi:hypothetical protein JCM16303_007381 [Sporobolomyces ruberrimus]